MQWFRIVYELREPCAWEYKELVQTVHTLAASQSNLVPGEETSLSMRLMYK